MTTASPKAGWTSVHSMKSRFEPLAAVRSPSRGDAVERLRGAAAPSERLKGRSPPRHAVTQTPPTYDSLPAEEALVTPRDAQVCDDDRFRHKKLSDEFIYNGYKTTPRRLRSNDGPVRKTDVGACLDLQHRKTSSDFNSSKIFPSGHPELLSWKSLQNVTLQPGRHSESPQNVDGKPSHFPGINKIREVNTKVNFTSRIRNSLSSPGLHSRKHKFEIPPQSPKPDSKPGSPNDSPVMNFRERKLAFEKAVGALDETFKSLSRNTLGNKPNIRRLRSNDSSYDVYTDSFNDALESASPGAAWDNSSFETDDSTQETPPATRCSQRNSVAPLATNVSSAVYSSNSFGFSPAEKLAGKTEARDEVQNYDCNEKKRDVPSARSNRCSSARHCSNESHFELWDKKQRDTRNEADEDEVPVFCVQDFNRGKEKIVRVTPCRSRSEGAELKPETCSGLKLGTDSKSVRKLARSSCDVNGGRCNSHLSDGFREKQRMLEEVMNAENKLNELRYQRERSSSPTKRSKVFRKISFTYKPDKDKLQNRTPYAIAVYPNLSNKEILPKDNSKETSVNRISLSKLISKRNALVPTLRFPLSSPEKTRRKNSINSDKKANSVQSLLTRSSRENHHAQITQSKTTSKSTDHIEEIPEVNCTDGNQFLGQDIANSLPDVNQKTKRDFVGRQVDDEINPAIYYSSLPLLEQQHNSMVEPVDPIAPPVNSIASPVKPSELYVFKNLRTSADFSRDNSDDTAVLVKRPPSAVGAPIRPPRRRNPGAPRKKSQAPQPPTLASLDNNAAKSSQDSSHSAKASDAPKYTSTSPPEGEGPTLDVLPDAYQIVAPTKPDLNGDADEPPQHSDVACVPLIESNIRNGEVIKGADISSDVPSVDQATSNKMLLQDHAAMPSKTNGACHQSVRLAEHTDQEPKGVQGTCQLQNVKLLHLLTCDNLTNSETKDSISAEPFLTTSVDNNDGEEFSLNETSSYSQTVAESNANSKDRKAASYLPPGPPPQKPPRTFAYEEERMRSSRPVLPHGSPPPGPEAFKEHFIEVASSAVPAAPIYSVVKKRSPPLLTPNTSDLNVKPEIAPKPAHISALVRKKRFSLAESTPCEVGQAPHPHAGFSSFSQLRYSLRKHPPHLPPPSPPCGPPPSTPTTASALRLEQEACVRPGAFDRQKSLSDETLCSSSGYHRTAEHVYATPNLRPRDLQRSDGEGLHYMCSDLMLDAKDVGDRRASVSPARLISAWKLEFRQSCRLVHNKLKKTVQR
ncbi:uncharacterized protein LOC108682299 [Hyalella azteca]|uniref:Uncharacterized protein LOC108682299 n=1 Tax=Hyalella azteca TaxID=294128 RepID=A0A8B7PND0_HYAAZ|nr:uncharacterized protein LOC108682299 [Hyalella azteca]